MDYIGIDVSKDEIVLFTDTTGEHFSIPNTKNHIKSFLDKQKFNIGNTIIGCESTGDYHLELCQTCLDEGYKVKLINPILTKQIICSTIRKKKTDFSDAEILVKLLKDNQGDFISHESLQQTKRTMLRTQKKIVDLTSDLKRIKKSLLVKSKSMDIQDSLEAVDRCIDFLENESNQLTQKATEHQDRQEEIVDSVPGCGEKLAAIISTEAGDIKRFPTAKQFKAYVGIDPKVTQSGNSLFTGKITKRGNPNLRYALYLAANIARIYDPVLKDFYDKKRTEGKSHRHSVCAVSRKLCERIYAIVSKDCLYQKNFYPSI